MPALHRRLVAGLVAAALFAPALRAQTAGPRLSKVVDPRGEVTIGLTEAELQHLDPAGMNAPKVKRLARALVANGQITAWRYAVARAPDGGTRSAVTERIAIRRHDALRIEPYAAAPPVAPLPAE